MIGNKLLIRASIFSLGVLAAAMAWAHEGHQHDQLTGVVRERMEAMSDMAKRIVAINRRVRTKKDLSAISADPAAIRSHAVTMAAMFPPGSTQPPTEASPDIWRNFSDFESKAKSLANEADRLAVMMNVGDQKLAAQVAVVVGTCSGCHEKYRVPQ